MNSRRRIDDPYFAQPRLSAWEEQKNDWAEALGDKVEHQL